MHKWRRFIFPLPVHSIVLFTVWLVLNNSAAVSTITVGFLLAMIVPLLLLPFCEPLTPIRKPLRALLYLARLVVDIILASAQVAINILQPTRLLSPGFIAIPLDLHEDFPLALLASSVSLTPGTVSSEICVNKQWLYVHVLHLDDEQALIAEIKQRYEAPLKEIFQC